MNNEDETKGEGGATEAGACARLVLETVPLVMRVLRREMRRQGGAGLSVPRFRVLVFLGRHPGSSLTVIAEHLGVTGATASIMVERLVQAGLVTRKAHPEERRRVEVFLTPAGEELTRAAREGARAYVAGRLSASPADELRALARGLDLLRNRLADEKDDKCHDDKR